MWSRRLKRLSFINSNVCPFFIRCLCFSLKSKVPSWRLLLPSKALSIELINSCEFPILNRTKFEQQISDIVSKRSATPNSLREAIQQLQNFEGLLCVELHRQLFHLMGAEVNEKDFFLLLGHLERLEGSNSVAKIKEELKYFVKLDKINTNLIEEVWIRIILHYKSQGNIEQIIACLEEYRPSVKTLEAICDLFSKNSLLIDKVMSISNPPLSVHEREFVFHQLVDCNEMKLASIIFQQLKTQYAQWGTYTWIRVLKFIGTKDTLSDVEKWIMLIHRVAQNSLSDVEIFQHIVEGMALAKRYPDIIKIEQIIQNLNLEINYSLRCRFFQAKISLGAVGGALCQYRIWKGEGMEKLDDQSTLLLLQAITQTPTSFSFDDLSLVFQDYQGPIDFRLQFSLIRSFLHWEAWKYLKQLTQEPLPINQARCIVEYLSYHGKREESSVDYSWRCFNLQLRYPEAIEYKHWYAYIQKFISVGDSEKTFRVFRRMRKSPTPTNLKLYHLLYRKIRDHLYVEKISELMRMDTYVSPNTWVLNAQMEAFLETNDFTSALEIWDQLSVSNTYNVRSVAIVLRICRYVDFGIHRAIGIYDNVNPEWRNDLNVLYHYFETLLDLKQWPIMYQTLSQLKKVDLRLFCLVWEKSYPDEKVQVEQLAKEKFPEVWKNFIQFKAQS